MQRLRRVSGVTPGCLWTPVSVARPRHPSVHTVPPGPKQASSVFRRRSRLSCLVVTQVRGDEGEAWVDSWCLQVVRHGLVNWYVVWQGQNTWTTLEEHLDRNVVCQADGVCALSTQGLAGS